jgi:hypothetical protein
MFKILKAIKQLLSDNIDVTYIVGNKIFPNVAPDKDNMGRPINYPMIVMRRTAMTPTPGKGCDISSTDVEIICYATSYDEVIDLAERVYNALNGFSGEAAGMMIGKINFASADEAFVDVAYAQQLVFIVK